jgi:amino acid adenylation domain-containing protein
VTSATTGTPPAAGPTEIEGYRLSPQQAALWTAPAGASAAASRATVSVTGPASPQAVRAALAALVSTHEILRTNFHRLPAMRLPLQVVRAPAPLRWREHDLSGVAAGRRPELLAELVARDAAEWTVELSRDPVVSALWIGLGPGAASLHLQLPAAAADAATLLHLVDLLSATIAARAGGSSPPAAQVQYAQYAQWRDQLGTDPDEAAQVRAGRDYWQGYGWPANPAFDLPAGEGGWAPPATGTAVAVPAAATPAAANSAATPAAALAQAGASGLPPRRLGPAVTARIDQLSGQLGVAPATLLLASWAGVLGRLTAQSTLVIDTMFDGRAFPELAGAPGPFSSWLPVQLGTDPARPYRALVTETDQLMAAHHQWFELAPAPPVAGPYRLGFAYLSHPAQWHRGEVTLSLTDLHAGCWQTGLLLSCRRAGAELMVDLRATRTGYREPELASVMDSWQAALTGLLERPGRSIGWVPLLSDARRQAILDRFGRGATAPVAADTVADRFERQVARDPDAVAVTGPAGNLHYAQLNQLANGLAERLRLAGVRPGDPVALCLERGPEAVVGLLAILKLGAVYLPVDPADPAARLAALLAGAGAVAVIAKAATDPPIESGLPVVTVDVAAPAPASSANPRRTITGGDPAYIIHTSGSTGTPKGVVVAHRSLLNHLDWVDRQLVGTVWLPAVTRLTFDASLKQILGPLLRGGTVWLLPGDAWTDPAALCQALRTSAAAGTAIGLNAVPSLWRAVLEVLEAGPSALLDPVRARLRLLLLGGDTLPAELVARTSKLLPETAIWNLYGPTEATVNASAARVDRADAVTIGEPADNTRVLILTDALEPVPVGVTGRLYIGGVAVAQGYAGRPVETAARFLPDPFSPVPGQRLYDSGDLGRYLPDGRIELLGRDDLQVKVHGFRLELAGIEAALRGQPAVREAAVAVREPAGGGRLLAGYVVAEPGAELSVADLRGALGQVLPDHAIPASLRVLAALPRTPSGKLDRRALAELPAEAQPATVNSPGHRSLLAEEVAGVWSQLLRRGVIRPADNFLDLGGHSLLVISLMSRIRDAVGVRLAPAALFEAPTFQEFVADVERAARLAEAMDLPPLEPVPRQPLLPLSFSQRRLLVHELFEPDTARYHTTAVREIAGIIDEAAVEHALAEILRRHEILRTGFVAEYGDPELVIVDECQVPLSIVDLRGEVGQDRLETVQRQVAELAAEPLPLAEPPLLRARLLRLAGDRAVVVVVLHHIACDGWGKAVLLSEFASLYRAAITGVAADLPELPVQYVDYSAWEQRAMTGQVLERHLRYWRDALAGAPVLDLPTDHPRTDRPSHRARVAQRRLPPALTERLRSLSARTGATGFMTSFAVYLTLLAHYSGETDIVVGTPVANRPEPALERLVGNFVNTIPLRVDLSGDPSFIELVQRVRRAALAAYAHQELPFDKLVEDLRPVRDRFRTPIFQVMFTHLAWAEEEVALGAGTVLRPVDFAPVASIFDLDLFVLDAPDGCQLFVTVDGDLFEPATAHRILDDFEAVLRAVTEDPDRRLSGLPLAARSVGDPPPGSEGATTGGGPPVPAEIEPAGLAGLVAARYVPPRTQLEVALVDIWERVLDQRPIGIRDDFFALGGHSLLMVRLVARVRQALGVEVPLPALADHPRIADFAGQVGAALERGPAPVDPPLTPVDRDRPLPLSFAQERMWLAAQLAPDRPLHHVLAGVEITGELDPRTLARALSEVVARHEVLRTGYPAVKRLPSVTVAPAVDAPVELVDLRRVPREEQQRAVQDEVRRRSSAPFDLATPPLLRAVCLRLADREWLLAFVIHHIVCDEWSIGVLLDDLASCYRAVPAGEPVGLAPLPIQYVDFAAWQRARLTGARLTQQLTYWRDRLRGAPRLELPTDHPRPARPTHRGGRVQLSLPAATLSELRELSTGRGVTMFMATLAGFVAALRRHSGQDDFCVGTPVTNRLRVEVEQLIGCFLNTLALRVDLAGDPTFAELLGRVRQVALEGYANQEVPYERVLTELRLRRDRSLSPLFQVMFVYLPQEQPSRELSGATVRPAALTGTTALFDLLLLVREEADGLQLVLTYDRDLFAEPTAHALLHDVATVLRTCARAADRRLAEIWEERSHD